MMKTKLKKIVLALGSLAILGVATQASALPNFTIQPGAIPGTANVPGGVGPLDNVSGNASELLTPTSATTFSGTGVLPLSLFNLGLNPVYFPSTFHMYITFSITDSLVSGTFGQPGSQYAITSLNFNLYADPNNNDSFTHATIGTHYNDGSGTYTGAGVNPGVTNTTDDLLLGFGSLSGPNSGAATLNSGGGSTGAALNSSESLALCSGAGTAKIGSTTVAAANCLSAIGTNFFIDPVPFYSIAFDEFNNTTVQFSSTTGQIALFGGTGSVNFAIPEPSSLALFGIAAVGLGLSARRRRKA